MNIDKFNESLFNIVTYPFVWIYHQLEYIFYLYIYPIWTGKPVAEGWNPKFVRENLHGTWKPSVSIDIPYDKCINMSNEALVEYGVEKTSNGHLRRFLHPQLYYANPKEYTKWGDAAWKNHLRDLELEKQELVAKLTLDPLNSVLYNNKLNLLNKEILSYNIQMKINFFGYDNIDLIEILFSIIFLFILVLGYFIFYHMYKLHLKLERAEYILNENGLSLFESDEERSAMDMHNAWYESSHISKRFDIGIELNYCAIEGTLIGFELFLIMFFVYCCKLAFSFLYTYIYLFYVVNMELFTYMFVYIFAFLSIYYWFKWKREIKKSIHKWVEIDYYFSHFLNHYFRTLCWLNVFKLVDDAPIFWYVVVYTLAMIWIYFACDSCDYFMGWNQEYRIDIYNKQTKMHFWWPRVLMNQTWHHFYIVLLKPWHKRIVYLILFIFLPILALCLFLIRSQNKIHVFINNKFFFWNSKRYTFNEIEEQWKMDRKYNYIEMENEKNNKERGLIIL